MTNIDLDVDDVDDVEYLAVRVSTVLMEHADGPEEWRAELVSVDDDALDQELDVSPAGAGGASVGVVLATAMVFRAHFRDAAWFDRMDSYDQQLASVAEEFIDREIIHAIDEDAALAGGLVVVYEITVRAELRRRELSHCLMRAIGRVFRSEIVALEPDGYTASTPGGEIHEDDLKLRAARRHWVEMGFIAVPDTRVMMLPLGARE